MSTTSRRVVIDIAIAIELPDERDPIDYMRAAHHYLMDRPGDAKATWSAGREVTITAAQVVRKSAGAAPFEGHGSTIAPEQAQTLQGSLL